MICPLSHLPCVCVRERERQTDRDTDTDTDTDRARARDRKREREWVCVRAWRLQQLEPGHIQIREGKRCIWRRPDLWGGEHIYEDDDGLMGRQADL